MVSRTLRKRRGEQVQSYTLLMSDKYLGRKRDPLSRHLKNAFLRGVPEELFMSERPVPSASQCRKYQAADPLELKPLYRSVKKQEAEPYPVLRVGDCQHPFSKWVLESGSFVDKKQMTEGSLTNAIDCHPDVQRFLVEQGYAEAAEIPAWLTLEEGGPETCFIDNVFILGGRIWLWDFKPNASGASNRHAVSQLLRCRRMLSVRLGIPENEISLAYGDHIDTYIILKK